MLSGVSTRAAAAAAGLVLAATLTATASSSSGAHSSAGPSARSKLDSQLLTVAETARGRGIAAARRRLASPQIRFLGARVRVMVEVEPGRAARAARAIERAGGRLDGRSARLVSAAVPPSALRALAADPAVRFVRPPLFPVQDNEGVAAIGANAWHAIGYRGDGVRIAVIDSDFLGRAPGLPFVQFCRTPNDNSHGVAVAEIVQQVAPAADIRLYCVENEVDLRDAYMNAKGERVQVIVQALSWFNSGRGDAGPTNPEKPEGIVAQARASGILWVNSAGNFAQRHWSGTFTDTDGTKWHDFAGSDEGNSFAAPAGSTTCAYLKWDDWGPEPRQPSSAQDYNLHLYRATGEPNRAGLGIPQNGVPQEEVQVSGNEQRGNQAPTEGFCYTNQTGTDETLFLAIFRFTTGPAPAQRFDLFVTRGILEHQVAAGSVVEPATSPAALAVGAACWQTGQLEPYSSRGPTIDGRVKPDLVAPDSVSVSPPQYGAFSACGTTGFRGTSASAPHVAGAAALVLQRNLGFTVDQLQSFLESHVVDLNAPGKDNDSGSGRLCLESCAVAPPPPPPPTPPPPPEPPPPPPPTLEVLGFRTTPKRAQAGRLFVARVGVARTEAGRRTPLQRARVRCAASVARKGLRPSTARFRGRGQAFCAWRLPRASGGKLLRGRVTVSYDGLSARRAFQQRIRRAPRR